MGTRVDYMMILKAGVEPERVILSALSDAYENENGEAPDEPFLKSSIEIRHRSLLNDDRVIIGVTVNLDGEPHDAISLVRTLSDNLAPLSDNLAPLSDSRVLYLLKLYDASLFYCNAQYAVELFEIEMKLREAVTVILLNTLPDDDGLLLQHTSVPANNDKPSPTDLRKQYENDLFYISFGGYASCNQNKPSNNPKVFIDIIANAVDFDTLRRRLTQLPISNPKHSVFIAELGNKMDPIEKVRNCV